MKSKTRHEISRIAVAESGGNPVWYKRYRTCAKGLAEHSRKRGLYDKWLLRDLDGDGDLDAIGTHGNSEPYDGVVWLEQVRTDGPARNFTDARAIDSQEMSLPE